MTSFPVSTSAEEAATTLVEVSCQPLVQVKYAAYLLVILYISSINMRILTRSSPTRVAAASVPPPPRTGLFKALEVSEEDLDQTMCSDLEELLIKYLEGEGEKLKLEG